MSNEEIVKSKNLKNALIVVGILLLVFVSFASGVAVGLRKAKFSYQWGQNYERNFMGTGRGNVGMMDNTDRSQMMVGRLASSMMGSRGGMMMDLPRSIEGGDFRNAYGLAGTIIAIVENNLLVKDRDGKENTVAVSDRTILKDHMRDIKITDLKTNDQIVVMGKPDDQGVISADLIRVFCCTESAEANDGNNN